MGMPESMPMQMPQPLYDGSEAMYTSMPMPTAMPETMSATWACRIDAAIDLQRPSRRAFDRLRECVIRTSATAPTDDSDSDSESADGVDDVAVAYEPTYTKNVIIEIQSG